MIKHLIFAVLATVALANGAAMAAQPTPQVNACLVQAAHHHQVSYTLLRAIAEQESGFNPYAVRGAGQSRDIGLMQINSAWLPQLARWGITAEHLLDPCVNAMVGAWVLATNIRQHGLSWKAVGAYNATSQDKQARYAWAIYHKINRGQGSVQ